MTARGPAVLTPPVRDWFARRSFEHDEFADLASLARRKRELGVGVSVVLPCREVAETIGAIADEVHALNEEAPLVDELIAVDAASSDGTAAVAERHGVTVYQEDELLGEFGPAVGKGDAMWRSLSVASGDVVLFLDADTTNLERHFVYGMLGPILTEPGVRFAKATYHRPLIGPGGDVLDDAGRVTELTAKPLLRIFFPELSGFGQPLAGELVADRRLLSTDSVLHGLRGRDGDADRRPALGRPRRDGPDRPRGPPQPLESPARARGDVVLGRARRRRTGGKSSGGRARAVPAGRLHPRGNAPLGGAASSSSSGHRSLL